MYVYGLSNAFPTNVDNNYWVDVVYSPSAGATPPVVTTVTPGSGSTGNAVSMAPVAVFFQPVTPRTVSFTVVDSGEQRGRDGGLQHRRHGGDVRARRSAGWQHYLYRDGVGGAECLGDGDERPVLVEFHHRRGGRVPVQYLADGAPTGSTDSNDPNAQTSGLRFQVASSGFITGVFPTNVYNDNNYWVDVVYSS